MRGVRALRRRVPRHLPRRCALLRLPMPRVPPLGRAEWRAEPRRRTADSKRHQRVMHQSECRDRRSLILWLCAVTGPVHTTVSSFRISVSLSRLSDLRVTPALTNRHHIRTTYTMLKWAHYIRCTTTSNFDVNYRL